MLDSSNKADRIPKISYLFNRKSCIAVNNFTFPVLSFFSSVLNGPNQTLSLLQILRLLDSEAKGLGSERAGKVEVRGDKE